MAAKRKKKAAAKKAEIPVIPPSSYTKYSSFAK